jgi:NAD(P)-dependent dehydrogenase (short-subunit alcohol dehydrogenase family)
MSLKDKVVVITGAGSGMGRAYAKVYAAAGARLALNDFDAASLAETVALHGGKDTLSAAFDVSDRETMFGFAEDVMRAFGQVDIVINNAGVAGGNKPVWELSVDDMERTLRINFYGVVNGTQAFLPHMLATGSGQLVNVSSIFGLVGAPFSGDYCASKFAVRGYTEALMAELQDTGVTAHLVHPGGIATNIGKVDGQELEFSKHYLVTPPEAIATHVLQALLKGRAKIVYGKDSFKTWVGSNLVPTGLMAKLVWRDIKPVLDLAPYKGLRKK